MARLAIKGHPTRGKEVIEIFEMLGGINSNHCYGVFGDRIYIIDEKTNEIIDVSKIYHSDYNLFTFEKFLEKYPFKVGDFVHVSEYDSKVCICNMCWNSLYNYMEYKVYRDGMPEWYTAKALLEYNEPNKEEIMKETNKAIFEGNAHCCDIMNDIIKDNIEETEEGVYAYNEINCYHQDFGDKVRIRLGGDFEIKIEDKLTYIVRKKPQYPKMYKECCSVLGMTYDYPDIQMVSMDEEILYRNFIILKRCRDAYWKIAGDEMGLNESWRPDWKNSEERRYCIVNIEGDINLPEKVLTKWILKVTNKILVFPTEEMRDAFYENFKDLIEECKVLL